MHNYWYPQFIIGCVIGSEGDHRYERSADYTLLSLLVWRNTSFEYFFVSIKCVRYQETNIINCQLPGELIGSVAFGVQMDAQNRRFRKW